MFDYDIQDARGLKGQVHIRQEGLYWQVQAAASPIGERVIRLYAAENGDTLLLGVLLPEEGELRLRKRIAVSGFRFTPDTVISTQKEPEWSAYRGPLLDQPRVEALRKGDTVALPYRPGEEFPFLAYFRRFRLDYIGQSLYWMIELSEDREKTVDNRGKCDKITPVS